VAQVVVCLLCKYEAMSSNHSPTKQKKKKKKLPDQKNKTSKILKTKEPHLRPMSYLTV
jgi:uncharacterized protein (DUF2225 family)